MLDKFDIKEIVKRSSLPERNQPYNSRFTIVLTKESKEKLEYLKYEQNINISQVIRSLIEEFIKEAEKRILSE